MSPNGDDSTTNSYPSHKFCFSEKGNQKVTAECLLFYSCHVLPPDYAILNRISSCDRAVVLLFVK